MPANATLRLRLRLPAVSLAVLLVAAVLLPDRIWNTMLVGLGGLIVVAYVWARQLAGGLTARRQLRYGWVAVGDRLEETFEVRNRSILPALWVEVQDESNVPGYSPAIVRSVGGGAADQWRQSAVCQQRGHFHLGPWAIRAADPFGIFEVVVRYRVSDEIIIHPPVHVQLPIILPGGQSDGRARARQRAWQATVNTGGVRDYHPRDPFHWIHWPTSARKDALYVREFDLDTGGDLWLVLDLHSTVQLGEGIEGTEEHAVVLAASLAAQAIEENRAVGLVVYGEVGALLAAPSLAAPSLAAPSLATSQGRASPTPTMHALPILPPGRGEGQQWRILHALALAHTGDVSLSTVLRELNRTARRGASAVIVTPGGDAAWLPDLLPLAQHGIRSSVVLLDRPSFGGGGHSDGLRDAIRQLGFNCAVIRQGEIGRPAEEQARRGFWEFRVLATGKVVTVRAPVNPSSREEK